jgi:teichoic acid transport system permease protein
MRPLAPNRSINSSPVDERGKISAPGTLNEGAVISADAPLLPDEPLADLAARHKLKLSGARPSLREYVVTLWGRRHFIVGYATARNVSMYTDAKLGQLWQVLTPLLNAGVYYLIFGILFEQSRGVDHYEAFLVAGVFVFAFTERSIVTASTVMRVNLPLIRALYFPRASLPLAYVIVELQQMLVGMCVLFAIVLAFGEPLTLYWFLLVPAIIMQALFNTGAALIVARMGGSVADVSELIPFFLRITRYFCGVMYMITTLPIQKLPEWVSWVLSLNPPAVFISLVRVALMQSYRRESPGNQPYNYRACELFKNDDGGSHISRATHTEVKNVWLQANCHAVVTNHDLWAAAVCWGVGVFVIGLIFFWRAEHLYGRG